MFSCFKSLDQDICRSQQIDKELVRDSKYNSEIIKLLLLGTGEAGKTTILKQMKILHIRAFTERERQVYIPEIQLNLHECIYEVSKLVDIQPNVIERCDDEIKNSIKCILEHGENGPAQYTPDYFENVSRIWKHQNVQNYFTPIQLMKLIDSAKYFLNRLDEIAYTNYIPTEQDILRCRKRTTSIQKLQFKMKLPRLYGKRFQVFWMYDVGGQRGERRKWIQVFSGIHAILFVVACSEFDQTLRENDDCNRLNESLRLFKEIWTSRFLLTSGFILFLNKQDVLEEKVRSGRRIGDYFPEYNAFRLQNSSCSSDEFMQVQNFIRHKFLVVAKTPRDIKLVAVTGRSSSGLEINQQCYHHTTVATDTQNIKTVFEDVHAIILNKVLREVGVN